jgi:glutathione synthase/RimK-type ligase-like ATP-grasp enzyme
MSSEQSHHQAYLRLKKKEVALVTYKEPSQMHEKLSEDDSLLVEPLKKEGFQVEVLSWDKDNVGWERFSKVIIRSTWDYHYRIDEYKRWLTRREQQGVPLWNPPEIVKWNLDKRYLLELKDKGISIIPTVLVEQGQARNLQSIIEDHNWQEIIIKPTVGASAYQIFKAKKEQISSLQVKMDEVLAKSAVLVQPFMPQVQTEGEYSFIFIGGRYSHTVLKRPQHYEFRVQAKFGGIYSIYQPSAKLIRQAENICKLVPSPLLYARVDCFNVNGELVLVELELNEPRLFLELHPQSAIQFAQAVKDW